MSDLIDRKAILKKIENIRHGVQMMDDTHRASIVMTGMHLCEEAVRNQPSAEPECNLDEWCADCKEYDHDKHRCPRWNRVIRTALEEAQPERKTGRWKMEPDPYGFFDEIPVCSECGCTTMMRDTYKFCPHCGAKMEQEDRK